MTANTVQQIPPIMTTQEAATVLRCSVETVQRYVHAHLLRAIQIGRERRIRADDLLAFIDARPTTAESKGSRGKARKQ